MNNLRHESSPYLLQHAHNPVEWYAWRPEAFERARAEDKPILVSIGYSTCHWCHVMERESFEDEETAAFMNAHFINIKVDREERPDVDQIYMEACQAISGSGGWPLNAFLTPDGRPFYAGTYYPPRPAYNRPSWRQLLQHLLKTFRESREVVEEQADRLVAAIQRTDSVFLTDHALDLELDQAFTPGLAQTVFQGMEQSFDTEEGGFGSAPKFPGAMSLRFLLEYHHFTGSEPALQHLHLSLEKMIRGGIYDQLGGGFARYATDRAWLVPHFEKMLYDNALLVTLLSEACQLTGERLYRDTIAETLAFVERELTSPEGGFYSALDADSEGEEGKFYLWDKAEVDRILGEAAPLFCSFYDITEEGNWEGRNILWRAHSYTEFARRHDLPEESLRRRLTQARRQLFAARAERVRPGLDDKSLLSWNALMCTAYVKAYAALDEEQYLRAAETNLDFLLSRFRREDGAGYYHTYKDGKAQYEGFLEDYAFLIEALLEVYSANFSRPLLTEAARLTDLMLDEFLDPDTKLFYFTSASQQDVILRKKELFDNAVPSGNSTMALNLQKLGILLGRADYRALASDMLKQIKHGLERYPGTFARWGRAALRLIYPWHEIAVVGPEAEARARAINRLFIPNKVIAAAREAAPGLPLLQDKGAGADTKIYVCKDYACGMPVETVAEVETQVLPLHRVRNK